MIRKVLCGVFAIAAVAVSLVGTSMAAHQRTLSSSCSAKNDNGNTCSVTCPDGQTANCADGSGANAPSCTCS